MTCIGFLSPCVKFHFGVHSSFVLFFRLLLFTRPIRMYQNSRRRRKKTQKKKEISFHRQQVFHCTMSPYPRWIQQSLEEKESEIVCESELSREDEEKKKKHLSMQADMITKCLGLILNSTTCIHHHMHVFNVHLDVISLLFPSSSSPTVCVQNIRSSYKRKNSAARIIESLLRFFFTVLCSSSHYYIFTANNKVDSFPHFFYGFFIPVAWTLSESLESEVAED